MRGFYWALATYTSAMFFGTLSTVLIKYVGIHQEISLIAILCLRAVLSFVILCPARFRELKTIRKKHLKLIIMVGLLSVSDTFCWHSSVAMIPINNAIIISFCTPILITILASFMLKERIYWFNIISFFIGISSVVMVYKLSATDFNYGYLIIALSVISSSFGFVFSKVLTHHYNPLLVVFIKVIATLSLLLMGGVEFWRSFDTISFILVAGAAIAYITERYCITKAYQSSDIIPLQPARFSSIVFGSVLGYLILGEKIEMGQVLAFMLIVLANYISAKNYTIKKNLEKSRLWQ